MLNFASANKAQMDAHLGGVACLSTPCPIYDPSAFRASDGSFIDAVVLTWNGPAIAAARFEIERRVVGTLPYSSLNANVDPSLLFYNDTSAATGVSYDYRIRSIRVDDGNPSDWIGPDSGFRGAVGPTNLSASDGEFSDRVRLSWSVPGGMNRIYVYRSSSGGAYVQVASLSGGFSAWSDLNVASNVSYNYKVRGFSNLQGMTAPSEPDLGFKLEAPRVTSASDGAAPSEPRRSRGGRPSKPRGGGGGGGMSSRSSSRPSPSSSSRATAAAAFVISSASSS